MRDHTKYRWPLLGLVLAFLAELLLCFWAASESRLSFAYVSPTLFVLFAFVLWFRTNKTLGLFGSALLGALFMNALIDAAFTWTLLVEGRGNSDLVSLIVPSFHLVLATTLFLWSKNISGKVRWIFAGLFAFFVLRALLLIPVYAQWSGEIAGLSQKISSWTGVEMQMIPVQTEVTALNSSAEEKSLVGCERPNITVVNSTLAIELNEPLVWGECGFEKTLYKFQSELLPVEVSFKNETSDPVQLQLSLYDVSSKEFVRTWNLVLFPSSLQTVSDVQFPEEGALFVYAIDKPEWGVVSLFSATVGGAFSVMHSPFTVENMSK